MTSVAASVISVSLNSPICIMNQVIHPVVSSLSWRETVAALPASCQAPLLPLLFEPLQHYVGPL